jgi:hypothetical protein
MVLTELKNKYSKKYYDSKKDIIKAKHREKESCTLCGRCVSHQCMQRHQSSSLCASRRKTFDLVKDDTDDNQTVDVDNIKLKALTYFFNKNETLKKRLVEEPLTNAQYLYELEEILQTMIKIDKFVVEIQAM